MLEELQELLLEGYPLSLLRALARSVPGHRYDFVVLGKKGSRAEDQGTVRVFACF